MAVITTHTAETFNATMKSFAVSLPQELVEPFVQKLGTEALSRIVMKTPVDTGRARGNWQVTIGTPAQGWDETEVDKNGGATINKGTSTINQDLPPFPQIWITNNVPYIERLEAGHGGRPAGVMVANTINELGTMFV